jgi:hypothetical protein
MRALHERGLAQRICAGRPDRKNVGAPTFKVTLEGHSVWLMEYRRKFSSGGKKSGYEFESGPSAGM